MSKVIGVSTDLLECAYNLLEGRAFVDRVRASGLVWFDNANARLRKAVVEDPTVSLGHAKFLGNSSHSSSLHHLLRDARMDL